MSSVDDLTASPTTQPPRAPLSLLPDDDVSLSRLENLLQVPFLGRRSVLSLMGIEAVILRGASRACRAAIHDPVAALSSSDKSESLWAARLFRHMLSAFSACIGVSAREVPACGEQREAPHWQHHRSPTLHRRPSERQGHQCRRRAATRCTSEADIEPKAAGATGGVEFSGWCCV